LSSSSERFALIQHEHSEAGIAPASAMEDVLNPLISVITPSLNSGRYLEEAIRSVLQQSYEPFEHIVVDGGSTDETLAVLRKYPHLRWVSQPDRGQSDAMNAGFAMATGEVIVYLNADDWFEDGAFAAAARALAAGAQFVVGRVRVLREDGTEWINDPAVKLPRMLRWWEADAYCYNSAGYFYLREVQEAVGGFNVEDHYAMDFEFLVEAACRYQFTKVRDVLACFRHFSGTKSFETADRTNEIFGRFERYEALLNASERDAYVAERKRYLRGDAPGLGKV
jgi:glycosyltransferase involved in cell wall biosynthesis